MIKIVLESIQDVESFLKNDAKDLLLKEYPRITNPVLQYSEKEICNFLIEESRQRFSGEPEPEIVEVVVLKVVGNETDVVSNSHFVIKYNGYLYDFTAHQFTEQFNNLLSYSMISPVIQSRILDDSQINQGVSTVKYYAMVEVS